MQVGASWEESGLAWPSARELRVLRVQAGPPLWVTDFSEGIGERTVSTDDPSPEPPGAHGASHGDPGVETSAKRCCLHSSSHHLQGESTRSSCQQP